MAAKTRQQQDGSELPILIGLLLIHSISHFFLA